MDSLVFKKRSRETWTTECERCTGQQHKIKTKRKRFCMKCDRPSDDLKCQRGFEICLAAQAKVSRACLF